MIETAVLASLLTDYLPRQRWFGAADRTLAGVDIAAFEPLPSGDSEWPALFWVMATARFEDETSASYQVPVGVRPLEATERFLEGKGRAFLGDADTPAGPALVYDAFVDPDLAIAFLKHVAPDEEVHLVRPLNVEQSNTSVVYDERLIMKVFRRVADGPNPDVEVTRALAGVGFEHISAPVAEWHRDGRDLAVVRQFLVGATDGWTLAQTSLRDLYDSHLDPAESGGDFAPEAHRLGEITGSLHAALADAFGAVPGDSSAWADDMETQLSRMPPSSIDVDTVVAVYKRLRTVAGAGASLRIHGDYHLGQVMRADTGWYILDFEGEPARPLEERRRPSSPLRDVAGMLRSFHYAAQVALLERGEEADEELADLATRWEQRSADAFIEGYLDVDEVGELLPSDDACLLAMLDAFTVDKAVYEVRYELANRPSWVPIPIQGLERVLASIR